MSKEFDQKVIAGTAFSKKEKEIMILDVGRIQKGKFTEVVSEYNDSDLIAFEPVFLQFGPQAIGIDKLPDYVAMLRGEITRRENRRNNKTAVIISSISLIFSGVSMIVAVCAYYK